MSKLDEDLSYEDLVEYALELEKKVEDRDNEIAEFTKGQAGKGRRKGARGSDVGDDYSILEEEIKQLREKTQADQLTITKLREEVSTSTIKIQSLNDEKQEYERKIKIHIKRIDDLEKENEALSRKSKVAETESREVLKQKSVNFQFSQQLSQEIARLKEEKEDLENRMKKLEDENVTFEGVVAKLAEAKDNLEAQRDHLAVEKDELQSHIIELESDIETIAEKFEASTEAEKQLDIKNTQLHNEISSLLQKQQTETKSLQDEISALKQQLLSVKDTTKTGQIHKAYEDLTNKYNALFKQQQEMTMQFEDLLHERDLLSAKVIEMEENVDIQVGMKIKNEKSKISYLEDQVKSLQSEKLDTAKHESALEQEKFQLQQQIDELTNWKTVYEAGNGLSQLSKTQKLLNDDKRRLLIELENKSIKCNQLMDANEILSLAFEKLKKECGKPKEFYYDEFALHQEVQSTIFTLQYTIHQLEGQLSTLENENISLRKTLREQITNVVSSKGEFMYPGMTPDQLLKINQFAKNLLENKVELPLDSRSKDLLLQNQQLQRDMRVLNDQLLRYEYEISYYRSGGKMMKPGSIAAAMSPDKKRIENVKTSNAEDSAALEEVGGQMDNGEHPSTSIPDQIPKFGGFSDHDSNASFPLFGGAAGMDFGFPMMLEGNGDSEVSKLIQENHLLFQQLQSLQQQLQAIIDGNHPLTATNAPNTPHGMISMQALSKILAQNNSLMLKELHDLRTSMDKIQIPAKELKVETGNDNKTDEDDFQQDMSMSLPPSGRYRQMKAQGVMSGVNTPNVARSRPPSAKEKLMLDFTPTKAGGRVGIATPAGTHNNAYWTPHMHHGNMPFAAHPTTPGFPHTPLTPHTLGGASRAPGSAVGPMTPYGKQLLSNTLYNMNLPPEEWTNDVKEVTSYLMETLEQLYEREYDIQQYQTLMKSMESTLYSMKFQMMVCYHDYATQSNQWKNDKKQLIAETKSLHDTIDDLQLKIRRAIETNKLLQDLTQPSQANSAANRINDIDDPATNQESFLQKKILELTRKLTVYEVNEAVLARKYTSLQELYQDEHQQRMTLTHDFIEMEEVLKTRILQLETFKHSSSYRIGFLQHKLTQSIQKSDYDNVMLELQQLRQDYLLLFQQLLSLQKQTHKQNQLQEQSTKYNHLYQQFAIENTKLQHYVVKLEQNYALLQEEYKVLSTQPTVANGVGAGNSTKLSSVPNGAPGQMFSTEMTSLVSEIAKLRGEITRLEVELVASTTRNEYQSKELSSLQQAYCSLQEEFKINQQELSSLQQLNSSVRQEFVSLQQKYANGFTKEQKESYDLQLAALQQQLQEKTIALQKESELLNISNQQNLLLSQQKQTNGQQIDDLQQYIVQLESAQDDTLLIGRLQRQLLSMKMSYKSFVRKYQNTRELLRKKEISVKVLEEKVVYLEKMTQQQYDDYVIQLSSLQKAVTYIEDHIFEITMPTNATMNANMIIANHATSGANSSIVNNIHQEMFFKKLLQQVLNSPYTDRGDEDDEKVEVATGAKKQSSLKEEQLQQKQEYIQQIQQYFLLHPITSNTTSIPGTASNMTGEASSNKLPPSISTLLPQHKYMAMNMGAKILEITKKLQGITLLTEFSFQCNQHSESDNQHLQGEIEKVMLEKSILLQRVKDLEVVINSTTGSSSVGVNDGNKGISSTNNKQQIANRLIQLYEELRSLKVNSISQRRTIQHMREENRHYKQLSSQLETTVQDLEKKIIDLEMKLSTASLQQTGTIPASPGSATLGLNSVNASSSSNIQHLQRHYEEVKKMLHQVSKQQRMAGNEEDGEGQALVLVEEVAPTVDGLGVSPDDGKKVKKFKTKLQLLQEQMASKEKAFSEQSLHLQQIQDLLKESQQQAEEQSQQIQYYARILQQEGLGNLLLQPLSGRNGNVVAGSRGNHEYRIMPEEQEKLQQAANATIGSLKQLLAEKNTMLSRYREKLDQLLQSSNGYANNRKSVREQQIDELLDSVAMQDMPSFTQQYSHGRTPQTPGPQIGMINLQVASKQLEEMQNQYQGQVDNLNHVLQEKQHTINQLEIQLSSERNAKERAELRCGDCLQEMNAMKEDMMTLIHQLQESEQRLYHLTGSKGMGGMGMTNRDLIMSGGIAVNGGAGGYATPNRSRVSLPPPGSGGKGGSSTPLAPIREEPPADPLVQTKGGNVTTPNFNALQMLQRDHHELMEKHKETTKQLKSKDGKLKSYREIIVKLKDELIKLEQEKAILQLQAQGPNSTAMIHEEEGRKLLLSQQEVGDLRAKIASLTEGLHATRQDIEKAKKGKEKLTQQVHQQQEEITQLTAMKTKLESQYNSAMNYMNKYKKEIEECKKKEVRYKEKIKEMTATGGTTTTTKPVRPTGAHGHHAAHDLQRIDQLEQENELLKAQQAALMRQFRVDEAILKDISAAEGATMLMHTANIPEGREIPPQPPTATGNSGTGGHILGTGPGNMDDMRIQLHQKWEMEKKLQKRVGTLEKRLQDVMQENTSLKSQMVTQHQQQLVNAMEESNKKAASGTFVTPGGGPRNAVMMGKDGIERKLQPQDVFDLDQAQTRIFELEDQIQILVRKTDVDYPNQIQQLQHTISRQQHQIMSLEQELIESEEKRKKAFANSTGGIRNSTAVLQSTEEHYLRAEKLSDELQAVRQAKLSLESQLLSKEQKLMELQFDVENTQQERLRYQRRYLELERSYKVLQSLLPTVTAVAAASSSSTAAVAAGNTSFTGAAGNTSTMPGSILTREEDRLLSTPIHLLGGNNAGNTLNQQGGTYRAPMGVHNSSKREMELESVIESMKRVIDKFRQENERLKRGIGTPIVPTTTTGAPAAGGRSTTPTNTAATGGEDSGSRPNRGVSLVDYEKKYALEKKKVDKLEEERATLTKKLHDFDDLSAKMAMRQQQITSLKKQLTSKDEDILKVKEQLTTSFAENEQLKRINKSLEDQITNLNITNQKNQQQLTTMQQQQATLNNPLASNTGNNSAAVQALKRENEQLQRQLLQQGTDMDVLQQEVQELRRKMLDRSGGIGGGGMSGKSGGGNAAQGGVSRLEYDRLREENMKLKEELSAFDLEFFEEIENLKFAHAEALRKLRLYEGGNSGGAGRDRDRRSVSR